MDKKKKKDKKDDIDVTPETPDDQTVAEVKKTPMSIKREQKLEKLQNVKKMLNKFVNEASFRNKYDQKLDPKEKKDVENILKKFGLKLDINTINKLDSGGGKYTDAMDALQIYYFDHGMPYGVAKARTGDPYDWVFDKLESMLEEVDVKSLRIDGRRKSFKEKLRALGYGKQQKLEDDKEEKAEKKEGKRIWPEKVEEGNPFTSAMRAAKEKGEKEFTFDGKTFKVEEIEEGSAEEYEKFFKAALKKFGVESPADFKTDEEKKKFFNYVDKNYKGEKTEENVTEGTLDEAPHIISKNSRIGADDNTLASYANLNDAKRYFPELDRGRTEIWYWKKQYSRDMTMGYEWLKEKRMELIPKDTSSLKKTHSLIGAVKGTNKENVFSMMQGENWSPNGEAFEMIGKSDTGHTSMSVGDIIKIGNKMWMVDSWGFEPLN